ncbi:MAG: endolytic transglycosylase MltG [Xanthobacteraceae bacterium]
MMEAKRITPRSPRAALEPENVPMPTRRSMRARHPLIIVGNALFTILVIVVIAVGVSFFIGKQWFEAVGPLPEDKVVNIPARSGIRDIADLLQHEGVIDKPWIFVIGATALKLKTQSELKAGEYQFSKQASVREAVETILGGKAVQHLVTVAEGLTSEQIVQRLMDSEALSGNIKELPREGTLLPETYKINRGTPREQLIQRMQQDQRRVLQEIWDRRNPDLPVKTPEQLVILASIIEKETGRPDERTRVAAVFVNRLKQKMRLQSDPTITYGLVGGKGSLGHPITRNELEQPTPYNTYVIDGLPPGPITNPGRASLEAAANPARTKEVYFVADGTGGHAFAETYEQHQKNVARLRAIEHQQRDTSVAPAEAQPAAATAASNDQPALVQPPNGKKKK